MSSQSDLPEFGAHPRNIQYTVKAARLLNQTETGVARVFAEQSENFLERQYGTVFAVIDLSFTSDFYDVGEVLVDTLRKDFYSDLNQAVEQSFERALTGVNQTLADLAAEGQNDWVGQLNALVGVVHENELYISQVGKAEAYLVRGPSVTHITDGLQSSRGASAKTFLNVASGDLEVGDEIRLVSGGWAKILDIKFKGKGEVFNFSVANNNNYYVGNSRLLTHNANCPVFPS